MADLLERRVREVATQLCAACDARCQFAFVRRAPAVVNQEREARSAARATYSLVGPELTLPQEPAMPSEDFAYLPQACPGTHAFIGNGDGLHRAAGHGEGP